MRILTFILCVFAIGCAPNDKKEKLMVGDCVVMVVGYQTAGHQSDNGWFYPRGLIGKMECYHDDCKKDSMADTVSFGGNGAISFGDISENGFNDYNFFSPDVYLRKAECE